VVALDGSPLAEMALAPAADLVTTLSAPHTAHMHLLRVVVPSSSLGAMAPVGGGESRFGLGNQLADARIQEAQEYLRAVAHPSLVATVEPETPHDEQQATLLSITELVVVGADVADAIAAVAEGRTSHSGTARAQFEPDSGTAHLIAVATHGRSGLKRWLLGSVTERLLSVAQLPLVVVPPTVRADRGTPPSPPALSAHQTPAGR
jgi:nucleotide-binding universal stress UspA family protein